MPLISHVNEVDETQNYLKFNQLAAHRYICSTSTVMLELDSIARSTDHNALIFIKPMSQHG